MYIDINCTIKQAHRGVFFFRSYVCNSPACWIRSREERIGPQKKPFCWEVVQYTGIELVSRRVKRVLDTYLRRTKYVVQVHTDMYVCIVQYPTTHTRMYVCTCTYGLRSTRLCTYICGDTPINKNVWYDKQPRLFQVLTSLRPYLTNYLSPQPPLPDYHTYSSVSYILRIVQYKNEGI